LTEGRAVKRDGLTTWHATPDLSRAPAEKGVCFVNEQQHALVRGLGPLKHLKSDSARECAQEGPLPREDSKSC